MGFLLRENSYLLQRYPTIKVFCGLAVKQRGPEVEITGFSFWLRHKFPLSELWAMLSSLPVSPWLCHCGVPGGAGCDVTELSQTWHALCLCGRWWESLWCQHLLLPTPREMFLLCPTAGVWEPGQCHALLWALLMVQMQPEIFLSSSSLRDKIQTLSSGFLSSPKLHQSFLMLWIYNFASHSSTLSCFY